MFPDDVLLLFDLRCSSGFDLWQFLGDFPPPPRGPVCLPWGALVDGSRMKGYPRGRPPPPLLPLPLSSLVPPVSSLLAPPSRCRRSSCASLCSSCWLLAGGRPSGRTRPSGLAHVGAPRASTSQDSTQHCAQLRHQLQELHTAHLQQRTQLQQAEQAAKQQWAEEETRPIRVNTELQHELQQEEVCLLEHIIVMKHDVAHKHCHHHHHPSPMMAATVPSCMLCWIWV